jgi:serine/threonine-protein kinase RsbW
MPGPPGQASSPPPFVFESHLPWEEKSLFFEKFREFASEQKWAAAVVDEIELILEEWLTNVIEYGFTGMSERWVRVEFRINGDEGRIRVEDNGVPFNPTTHPDPDITKPAEERPIGGLGVFLVKRLSSEISYERRNGRNVLIIRKNLVRPALGKK